MRIFLTAALAATAITPLAATAQTYGEFRGDQREVRQDQRQVRQDQREVHQDRQDVRAAEAYGSPGDVHHARQELRDDRQEMRDNRQEMRDDRRATREDWRDYRNAHPDWYRRGVYRGPAGYRYRPVSVGYRFAPGYYGRSYWVNDWQRYRLAAPLGYQRWVRYGNDVVLVDIRSGRVADVRGGFFF